MSGVKLPRDVADAIVYFRKNENLGNADIVFQSYHSEQHTSYGSVIRDYAADNFDIFLNALVNGYEVEESPDDKVREIYKKLANGESKGDAYLCGYNIGGRNSIINVLKALNITIEGVNDFE